MFRQPRGRRLWKQISNILEQYFQRVDNFWKYSSKVDMIRRLLWNEPKEKAGHVAQKPPQMFEMNG